MSRYTKSIVASGHAEVSRAAGTILEEGGNAFDAVVAAGFASAVVEPALTSLGGGGLLVGRSEERGKNVFFDFFVDSPGRGRKPDRPPDDFFAVTVQFSGSSQDFNVGCGSVAVPGTLKGLLHTHRRLGRMGLGDVIAPAAELARSHLLNEQQGHFLQLLRPIMTLSARGRAIYEPGGKYLQPGDRLCNPEIASFLDQLATEGDDSFYRGEIAGKIDAEMRDRGGWLSYEDLASYKVRERKALNIPYRNGVLVTPGEPSMGGTLIGLSLSLMAEIKVKDELWGTGLQLVNSVGLMNEVERLRKRGITSFEALIGFMEQGKLKKKSMNNIRLFSRGTTHVSVADRHGNCASMTCSNGEGSGYFAPTTGIMINNMMGEDDLHPEGFHLMAPGKRVYSMMSPSLFMEGDRVRLVIGSGGSKRIRTAITQVLSQVVDFDLPLQRAVDSPRLYLDEGLLQIEPGFDSQALDQLENFVPVNRWTQRDVYFGGVHAVIPGVEGAGDPRRGGAVVVVNHPAA
ncbi:gamma-glutamyltransferase family protein [Desulforhopalus singaporensis]|uniref:Gamma-glutamyltranspeptidase / glutathione hydrolase n=1 Tax=Desulforhopalus singaporensis TaxID=91360 RepID=A0A1H0MSD0_9BACT|nr:gamma-glutamyltransferase [Desulforhopalus singaporensis]SDO83216.1 gamma-glutamyltranspeptidase / glutathione hydrolase [Desulforhopalus singaporensis]